RCVIVGTIATTLFFGTRRKKRKSSGIEPKPFPRTSGSTAWLINLCFLLSLLAKIGKKHPAVLQKEISMLLSLIIKQVMV
ncbi:hypothetical protein Goari_023930, partial [Gossypium aridum]|nr:hypothetical protein [Gossypium aridum]